MENSPLRFLDFDASKILTDHVRLSQEEEARKFHDIVYCGEINLNQDNHHFISMIFKEIYYNIENNPLYIYGLDITWFELPIHERVGIFEQERLEEEERLKEEERLEEEASQYISDRSWYNYFHMSKP